MSGFATSRGPYVTGLKPRTFFAERKLMLQRETQMQEVEERYYPKWDVSRRVKTSNHADNPHLNQFMRMLPWVLAVSLAIALIL